MAQKPTEATMSTAAVSTAGQVGIVEFRAILIVAGVSGSGKTTIATALAQRLGLPFTEGSKLYPTPDVAKMHSAHPLDDRQQWSWLEKIAAWIDGRRQLGTGGVITSPGLKRSHRDFLTRGRDRKSTRLNSSHLVISYAVFCLKKKKKYNRPSTIKKKKNKISPTQ